MAVPLLSMLLLAICLLLLCSPMRASETEITLVASSQFRMVLQPTSKALDFGAIHAIEESISSSLLAMQDGSDYLDMEIVIQQVELVPADDFAMQSATRLRFFVLATTVVHPTDNVADEKQALDLLITVTFTDSLAKTDFILQIHSALLLQNVDQIAVAPIGPAPSPAVSTSQQGLSTLDIALISISMLIFLGILYMVIEHHRDRGWLENQRMFTANVASHAAEHVSSSSGTPTSAKHEDNIIVDGFSTTPSSPNSDTLDSPLAASPRTPLQVYPLRLTNVSSNLPPTPIPLLAPSCHDVEPHSLLHHFEKHNCFHQTSPSRSRTSGSIQSADGDNDHGDAADAVDAVDPANDDIILNPAELDNVSSTESSEDVFHIDVTALHANSKGGSMEDEIKSKTSAGSSISDWINSIRVVPSSKTTTHSQSSNISTASMAESSMEQSSLGQMSLEHSMADSDVGEEFASAEARYNEEV